jgi:hypothetical protein
LKSIIDRKKRTSYEPGEVRDFATETDFGENCAPGEDDNSVNGDGSDADNYASRNSRETATEKLEDVFLLEVPFFTKVPDFEQAKEENNSSDSARERKNKQKDQNNRDNFQNKEKDRKHRHESRRRHFRGW